MCPQKQEAKHFHRKLNYVCSDSAPQCRQLRIINRNLLTPVTDCGNGPDNPSVMNNEVTATAQLGLQQEMALCMNKTGLTVLSILKVFWENTPIHLQELVGMFAGLLRLFHTPQRSRKCLEKRLEYTFWSLAGHMALPLPIWVAQDMLLIQQFWQFPHLYYGEMNSCKKGYWSGFLVKLILHYYISPWLTVSK